MAIYSPLAYLGQAGTGFMRALASAIAAEQARREALLREERQRQEAERRAALQFRSEMVSRILQALPSFDRLPIEAQVGLLSALGELAGIDFGELDVGRLYKQKNLQNVITVHRDIIRPIVDTLRQTDDPVTRSTLIGTIKFFADNYPELGLQTPDRVRKILGDRAFAEWTSPFANAATRLMEGLITDYAIDPKTGQVVPAEALKKEGRTGYPLDVETAMAYTSNLMKLYYPSKYGQPPARLPSDIEAVRATTGLRKAQTVTETFRPTLIQAQAASALARAQQEPSDVREKRSQINTATNLALYSRTIWKVAEGIKKDPNILAMLESDEPPVSLGLIGPEKQYWKQARQVLQSSGAVIPDPRNPSKKTVKPEVLENVISEARSKERDAMMVKAALLGPSPTPPKPQAPTTSKVYPSVTAEQIEKVLLGAIPTIFQRANIRLKKPPTPPAKAQPAKATPGIPEPKPTEPTKKRSTPPVKWQTFR